MRVGGSSDEDDDEGDGLPPSPSAAQPVPAPVEHDEAVLPRPPAEGVAPQVGLGEYVERHGDLRPREGRVVVPEGAAGEDRAGPAVLELPADLLGTAVEGDRQGEGVGPGLKPGAADGSADGRQATGGGRGGGDPGRGDREEQRRGPHGPPLPSCFFAAKAT
ncbi:hypothetical protein THAOC_14062, partial [Thalassiosira oceanica]